MRILWFNHRDIHHPYAGGAEVHLHEIGKRLVDQGNEVTLLCEHFAGAQRSEEVDGMRIHRIGGMFSSHLLAPVEYLRLEDRNFDVVVDDMAHGVPWFTPLYCDMPVVALVHHVHRELLLRQLRFPFSGLAYSLEQLMPLVYRNVPFIAVSDSTKGFLVKFGIPAKNITVVKNGMDHETYKPSVKKSTNPSLLHLGRLMRYKGIEDVFSVFGRVVKRRRDVKLTIVGGGELLEEMTRLVARKGLDQKVTITGHLPLEEKVRITQESWLSINCSVREGWPLAPMEAAACGTPTVAFDVPGLRDTVRNGESGILVPYGDLDALADAVLRVIEDEGLRRRLSRNAVDWAATFTWENAARETLNVLSIAANRGFPAS